MCFGFFRTCNKDNNQFIYGDLTLKNPRGDPYINCTFYPISDQSTTLIGGDVVASTCEMVNNEDHRIYIGPKVDNEMCNFYLMYWVDGRRILQKGTCISNGPPSYYWMQDLENVPL
uniref:Copper type II ascorbate-dependent monooxygenase C-terminal domain-containing protein n=1 Tax=Romanomermis culicivorax TaxID=13658 RepID=A0A915IB37_ROMCU